jgi:hypothetical protein
MQPSSKRAASRGLMERWTSRIAAVGQHADAGTAAAIAMTNTSRRRTSRIRARSVQLWVRSTARQQSRWACPRSARAVAGCSRAASAAIRRVMSGLASVPRWFSNRSRVSAVKAFFLVSLHRIGPGASAPVFLCHYQLNSNLPMCALLSINA